MKSKSKLSRARSGSRKQAFLGAALEEPVLPAQQLVGDERRDEVERSHVLGLCLAQSCIQDVDRDGDGIDEKLVILDLAVGGEACGRKSTQAAPPEARDS